MSLLHESEIEIDHPHRFRAPTIDAALADARAALGDDVRIVEANRIRRGGVGGFFATDLGVELVVAIGDDPGPDAGGVDPMSDPEYVDGPLNGRPLPRASAATSSRPHFYDRVVEEPAPAAADAGAPASSVATASPGIERLLDTAARTERGTPSSVASRATFADHLARHLDDGGAINPTVVVPRSTTTVAGPRPGVIDVVTAETATVAVAAAPAGPSTTKLADRAIVPEPADSAAGEAASAPTDATVSDSTGDPAVPVDEAAPDATDRPPVEAASAEPSARPARAGRNGSRRSAPSSKATRDPLRRPIDLAAGAVGRIVEQLSDVSPVEGSRMRDLSRLVVRVTTPDGSTIEIEAELRGDGDV